VICNQESAPRPVNITLIECRRGGIFSVPQPPIERLCALVSVEASQHDFGNACAVCLQLTKL
jgi:hypothetical protein